MNPLEWMLIIIILGGAGVGLYFLIEALSKKKASQPSPEPSPKPSEDDDESNLKDKPPINNQFPERPEDVFGEDDQDVPELLEVPQLQTPVLLN